jgi:hypothetical protein
MKATALIIAPTHSRETRLLSTAAVHLHHWLMDKGEESYILIGVGARKLPLLTMLNNLRGRKLAVFYYGHGTHNTLIGSEVLVRKRPKRHLLTDNEGNPLNRRIVEGLQGSMIYTVACDSAVDLGRWLTERGVRAFAGSTMPMWIVQNLDFDGNGVPDMTDLLTFAPRRLAENIPLGEAVESYKERAYEMRTNYTLETPYGDMADVIDPNVDYYTIIGDKGWKWND